MEHARTWRVRVLLRQVCTMDPHTQLCHSQGKEAVFRDQDVTLAHKCQGWLQMRGWEKDKDLVLRTYLLYFFVCDSKD